MKVLARFLFALILISVSINGQTMQEKINEVHSFISSDSVTNFIQQLENFGTRFEYSENRKEIANWLMNEFIEMGYQTVELDSFICNSTISGQEYEAMQYNVIATLPGTTRPDDIYVIGGHYDSFNTNPEIATDFAPGADDNASGTTAALETARAIMTAGYQPDATIQFVCFAAEELMHFGYSGSEYMAESRRKNDVNIKLMINNDMIANNPRALNESRVSINYYANYPYLRDAAMSLTEQFTVVTPLEGTLNQWSDSRPFYDQGYPAIYFEEYDFSPYYHTENDRLVNYDMEYCTEVIKASSAMLIYSIEAPSVVSNLVAEDVGNGSEMSLSWSPVNDGDLLKYNVYFGDDENNMQLYNSTEDTFLTVSGLEESKSYVFGVTAFDSDSNESIISTVLATPNSLPLPPADVIANAKWQSVELNWASNKELDLLTYKIYKVPVATLDYFPTLTFYTSDTTFTDTEIVSGMWYDYTVVAVDADSNESIDNSIITSRAVTLDSGILFVNETTSGDGSIGNPTLTELTQYYYDIAGNDFERYDVNVFEEDNFSLANLGAHQTVIWHVDKSSDVDLYRYIDIVKEYLDYGGNILYTGYKPSTAFANSTGMTNDFSEGDFIFDYFDISQAQNSIFALFKSAQSESNGYPNLELDPNKITTSDGHIKTIETITPNNENEIIYSYVTDYDQGNVKGAYSGEPIGVEFLSNDYNAVVLSVPLYLVKEEQASEFLNYVLLNKFNTPTGIDEDSDENQISNDFHLTQNYPNPFNPSTKISFTLPNSNFVQLKIFDAIGREVKTLVNEVKPAGTFEVEFDASSFSSGIYFYQLSAGSFVQTRKMILLK